MRCARAQLMHRALAVAALWALRCECSLLDGGERVAAGGGHQDFSWLHTAGHAEGGPRDGVVQLGHIGRGPAHVHDHVEDVEGPTGEHAGNAGKDQGHGGVHDEHGDGEHGHEEHHQQASREAKTMAHVLIFGCAACMGILYLANYQCPDVRCMFYRMLSTAMSVYCAVLINQAFFSFIIDQVLKGKQGRGLGFDDVNPLFEAVLGVVIFLIFLVGLQVACWKVRATPNHLSAIQALFAHLLAFAGIVGFGNFQNSKAFHRWFEDIVEHEHQLSHFDPMSLGYIAIIVAAFLFIVVVFAISSKVIKMKRKGAQNYHVIKSPAATPEEEDTDVHEWAEAVDEGQREAMAITIGFLNVQLVDFLIGGRLIDVHGHSNSDRDYMEICLLIAAGLLFGIALLVASWMKVTFAGKAKHKAAGRTFVNFRLIMSLSMAWCFARASAWLHHHMDDEPAMARVWSAFSSTALSVLCVIVLNCLLGFTQERRDRWTYADGLSIQALQRLDDLDEENQGDDAYEKLSRNTVMENALDHIVTAFAFVIGFSWEKAFEIAEDTLMDSVEHFVFWRCFLAVCLVVIALPGWALYIVPQARKTWRHHYTDIKQSQLRGQATQTTNDPPVRSHSGEH